MFEKILDTDYIESWNGEWKNQKKELIKRYEKRFNKKVNVKRMKSDTKGLRAFYVIEKGDLKI